MNDFVQARRSMVDSQLRPNRVFEDRLIDAMGAIAREKFVPASLASVAYLDEDIKLKPGRYLMEPMVVGRLLQEAKILPHEKVLELACGSGYAAAVMSFLCQNVTAIEQDPDLVATAQSALAATNISGVTVKMGDAMAGDSAGAPYDVILISAAVSDVPATLFDQLAEGGRLLAVVQRGGFGRASLYTKQRGYVSRRELFDATTALIPAQQAPANFTFA